MRQLARGGAPFLEGQLALVRRQLLRPLAVNDTLQFTHQMFETADALGLRFILAGEASLLFRQRLVLGAKRLQRRKRLHRGGALYRRQRSEVDLCKSRHGPLDSTVSGSRMTRSG